MTLTKVALIGGSGFIGFHLNNELKSRGFQTDIFDLSRPGIHFPKVNYLFLDIMDREKIKELFCDLRYSVIINLAAITNDQSKKISDYKTNYIGCKNLVEILEELRFEGQFIQISTQYVEKPISKGSFSMSPEPVNAYGESKKKGEEFIKNSNLKNWVILRPTNVWGPYHPSFPQGFWKIIRKGFYVHPNKSVIRSYGYVESVANQIVQFVSILEKQILKNIFYVGDDPIDSYIWVNEFSKAIRRENVRRVPYQLIFAASIFGEILKIFGIKTPLNLKRYRSMTTDYKVDMESTWEVISKPTINFQESIRLTAEWYKENYK